MGIAQNVQKNSLLLLKKKRNKTIHKVFEVGNRKINLLKIISFLMSMRQYECSSCGKLIAPGENAVNFPCPKCADVRIWRCERCRMFARSYNCPKCGFTGP